MNYIVIETVVTDYHDPELRPEYAHRALFVTDSKDFADKYVANWSRPLHDISEDPEWSTEVGELYVKAVPFVEPEFLYLSPKDICGDNCEWTDVKEEP